jgi:hypothetical protein
MANKLKYIVGMLFFLSSLHFSQSNRFCIGGYFGNSLSINSSFAFEFMGDLFAKPNISISLSKDDKDIYSFITYEASVGYYLYHSPKTKYYVSFGGSYNSFLSESQEGNASFISDKIPPYYYVGKSRDKCFGLSAKAGVISQIGNWLCFGLEAAYQSIFPNVSYNYIPSDYKEAKRSEVINTIVFGFVLGVSF